MMWSVSFAKDRKNKEYFKDTHKPLDMWLVSVSRLHVQDSMAYTNKHLQHCYIPKLYLTFT